MEFEVTISKDGTRLHEVTKRDVGENCERITQFNAGTMVSDERTGPDCDKVEEVQS